MSIPLAASSDNKKNRPTVSLSVVRREELSPHMIRLVAGGEGFADFADNGFMDRYVKIVFPRAGVRYPSPMNLGTIHETMPREQWPYTRTYTIRWVNPEARELAIDFVLHGDEGLAGPWAAQAQPGDTITFTGPGGTYNPTPDADWYLFAGDEAALPAIAACVESLPQDATGLALIEVDSAEHVQPIASPAGVELHWLFRAGIPAGESNLLMQALEDAEWPKGRPDVFAHGERGYMKALREVLFKQHDLDRKQVSLSGYWAKGCVEDVFQAEKKLPIGQT